MTKIMKGGIAYNATANMVALTQAEYDTLTTAQKNNGNFYFITDAEPSYFSAGNIDYSNTSSGLSATDIQGAIDEVDSTVDNIGILKNGTMSGTVNVANNTSTIVGSVTLNKGTYLVVAGVNWAANATGSRQVAVSTLDTLPLNPARNGAVTTYNCGSSKQVFVQISQFIEIAADSTVLNVFGWQDSGSSLAAYPFITTARLR